MLFINSRGEPIRHSDWLHQWHTACDGDGGRGRAVRLSAGPCPGARFHDLRHTHATMLAELGVPEVLRDDRLGHHPPGVRALYTHTTPAMRAAMVQSLEQLWHLTAVRANAEAAELIEGQALRSGRQRGTGELWALRVAVWARGGGLTCDAGAPLKRPTRNRRVGQCRPCRFPLRPLRSPASWCRLFALGPLLVSWPLDWPLTVSFTYL